MSDPLKKKFSLSTRIKSFSYALTGIKYLFRTQHNAWIHLVATAIVVTLGLVLDVSFTEWCFLIFAIGFVLVSEAFNTAIETLTDFISPNHHKMAEIIKDISAGAVLISAVVSAAIGLIIFIPKI